MSSNQELFKSVVTNVSDIEAVEINHYPGDDELMSLNASFAHHFNSCAAGRPP